TARTCPSLPAHHLEHAPGDIVGAADDPRGGPGIVASADPHDEIDLAVLTEPALDLLAGVGGLARGEAEGGAEVGDGVGVLFSAGAEAEDGRAGGAQALELLRNFRGEGAGLAQD